MAGIAFGTVKMQLYLGINTRAGCTPPPANSFGERHPNQAGRPGYMGKYLHLYGEKIWELKIHIPVCPILGKEALAAHGRGMS